MAAGTIYLWKEAPFIRLLIPFIAGIIWQWYHPLPPLAPLLAILIAGIIELILSGMAQGRHFRWYITHGISINIFFCSVGMLLTRNQQDFLQPGSLGTLYKQHDGLVVVLDEPLTEKPASYKTIGRPQRIMRQGVSIRNMSSGIVIYLEKDSLAAGLGYGSIIWFDKPLQPVKNAGNPFEFDYARYCAFQHTPLQVYLKKGEYKILEERKTHFIQASLFLIREKIVDILRRYLPRKKESGMAEALLIGYRDELDKTLVQSYANTGVVHIIAISGLHLALIYFLLNALFKKLGRSNAAKWIRPLGIIAGLWVFSILSGASPSVMRSAVMFSFIVIGETFSKKSSIYNGLAASAFTLLCYNPFWLWDAGFQLSYSAVLSIVIFQKPVYNAIFCENKLLDACWQSASVSISAQILTTPVSIYLFHQFPVYFLFTNLAAVPLSSIILLGEIILCSISFIAPAASLLGTVLQWLIWLMNSIVELVEKLAFSSWRPLQISEWQMICMYVFIAALFMGVYQKSKPWISTALFSMIFFFADRSVSFYRSFRQQQLIVYNIPKHRGMDFIEGTHFVFAGDSVLQRELSMQYFFASSTRIHLRTLKSNDIHSLVCGSHIFIWGNKKILLLDQPIPCPEGIPKLRIDLVILSGNPGVQIGKLRKIIDCPLWVFDGSVNKRNANRWTKECEEFGLKSFDVVEKGAFVMNMDSLNFAAPEPGRQFPEK